MKHFFNVLLCLLLHQVLMAQTYCGEYCPANNCLATSNNSLTIPTINEPLNAQRTINSMVGVNIDTNLDNFPDNDGDNQGDPDILTEVASYFRSFHHMNKDFEDTGENETVPNCLNPGNHTIDPPCPPNTTNCWGTSSMAEYYHRYQNLINSGFVDLHATLSAYPASRGFPNRSYTAAEWGGDLTSIETAAYNYATSFAKTFAPNFEDCNTCTDPIIDELEVGNEWWGIPGIDEYNAIFKGMKNGLSDYYDGPVNTWRLRMVPGAFQAYDPNKVFWDPTINSSDYIDEMIPSDVFPYISAINTHQYSNNTSNGSIFNYEFPESDVSGLQRIKSVIDWTRSHSSTHIKNLPIKVSEFGWDSKRAGNSSSAGVGFDAQAMYLNRSILMFAKWGIDKATIYSAMDNNGIPAANNYNSSGLLDLNFGKKPSFHAIKKLKNLLGDKIFLYSIDENSGGTYAYIFGDTDGTPTHLIAWDAVNMNNYESTQPLGYNDFAASSSSIALPTGISLNLTGNAYLLNDEELSGSYSTVASSNFYNNGTYSLIPVPVMIPLNVGTCKYNLSSGQLEGCGTTGCCSTQNVVLAGCSSTQNMEIEICDGTFSVSNIGTDVAQLKLFVSDYSSSVFVCNDWGSPICDGNATISLSAGTYHLQVLFHNNETCWMTDIDVDFGALPACGDVIGETGTLTLYQYNSNYWHTLNFENTYTEAVVVFSGLTLNGGDPSNVRVRNITSTSCEFQLDEWDYLNGIHITETFNYMVMEAGNHVLEDGTEISAGNEDITGSWNAINYGESFNGIPVVLSQVNSHDHTEAVATRMTSIYSNVFYVKLQREELNNQQGNSAEPESISWIAMQQNTGTVGGLQYESKNLGRILNHNWKTTSFQNAFSQTPVILYNMQSQYGGDPCVLRHRNLGLSTFQVKVEEEKSANTEVAHTTEKYGFIAFEPGDIMGELNTWSFKEKEVVESRTRLDKDEVKIFPNPADDILNIVLPDDGVDRQDIVIFDVMGRQIKEFKIASGEMAKEINVSDVQDGYYFLLIRGENNVETHKIIIH